MDCRTPSVAPIRRRLLIGNCALEIRTYELFLRYVGDVGDFVKYALLRAIRGTKRLGVAWYLHPNAGPAGDGRHTAHLQNPDEWRHLDAELFDALTGLSYSAGFCLPRRFRIELYVDADDQDQATRRFDALTGRREEIEDQFGENLEWERLESRRASRIASYYQDDIGVEERDRWPDLRAWAIERLGALREALQSHVDALP